MAVHFTKILIGDKEFNLVLPEKSGDEKVYHVTLDEGFNTVSGNINNLITPGIYKVNVTLLDPVIYTITEGAILQVCLIESRFELFLPSALAQTILLNISELYYLLIRIYEDDGYPTDWRLSDIFQCPNGDTYGDSVSVNFTNPTVEFGEFVTLGEISINGDISQVTFEMPPDPTEGFEERFNELESNNFTYDDIILMIHVYSSDTSDCVKYNEIGESGFPIAEWGDTVEVGNIAGIPFGFAMPEEPTIDTTNFATKLDIDDLEENKLDKFKLGTGLSWGEDGVLNANITSSGEQSVDTKNTAGATNSTSKLYLIGATSLGDNPLTYSNSKVYATDGNLYASAFYQTSDARKKDIKRELDLDKCYDLIDKCSTVIYTLKDNDKEQIGMIAQEVKEFFPEIVNEDEEGFLSLDYSRLTVILLRVVKDLIDKMKEYGNRN